MLFYEILNSNLSRVKGMKKRMKIIFMESKFQCIYYIDIRLMHLELLGCNFFSWVEEKMIDLSGFSCSTFSIEKSFYFK